MVVLGVLLLVSGVVFPLAMLFWLSSRLSRPPALRPRQVGLMLALNLMLPASLVLWALQLISSRLAAATAVQTAAMATSAATVFLVIIMAAEGLRSRRRRAGGSNDG